MNLRLGLEPREFVAFAEAATVVGASKEDVHE
ncbi:hypothetical protein SAMN05216378_1432 [Paenibacillus catalpae]|uniref:Uncharacterized protein n=1 Tax=Paenibacillus catalpae TaxID=1045775 RepID=A0A1I1V7V0_9BACL|nr:hypothetical protein SAMN05216378_1432 [Paenibacillus catalpae]